MTLTRWLIAVAVAFGLGYLVCFGLSTRTDDRKLVRNSIALAKAETVYVEAKQRTDTVMQTVTERITRYRADTLWRGDTVTLRDTLRILVPAATVASTDSTIRACSELVTSCQRERVAAQQVIGTLTERVKLLEKKPLRSRLGCTVGYGGVLSLAGTASHGPGVTCGFHWP